MSKREGENNFGRNLDREDPELDQFWYARKAKPHVDMPPTKSNPRSVEGDASVRAANVARRIAKYR